MCIRDRYILDKVGIKVGPEVKCIIMEAPKDHPFVQIELMMPILPIVRVPNVDVYKRQPLAIVDMGAGSTDA